MDQHKIDQAIAAYQQAIRLRAQLRQAHCNLGSAYAACKQWQQAAAAFETGVQLSPHLFELTPGWQCADGIENSSTRRCRVNRGRESLPRC